MKKQHAQYNRKISAGCSLLVLLVVTAVVGVGLLFVSLDRQAARYPDAEPISNHENYSGLPFSYKWDNTYYTTDPFVTVYNWYSTGFDLGPEMRGNGRCILMAGSEKRLAATRYTSVMLCDMPEGRMIYVSRSTSFR